MSTLTIDGPARILAPHDPVLGAPTLEDHCATHGPLVLPAPGNERGRSQLRDEIARSGLLGRGGAGFPTSSKWEVLARARQRPMVVVNAMEGEPASQKDCVLLSRAPHLVLDGADVAARAVNASRITVCIADDNTAAAAVERAIAERSRAGRSPCLTALVRPPGRYVTGEESALANWLNKGRALPTFRLDKSVALQVSRQPTMVHNAETLSQVALIARHGAAWFRQQGTAEAPGSTLVTVSGAVDSPGVQEVELGTPVAEIVRRAGSTTVLSAVLLGGYGGAWLDVSLLAAPYAPAALAAAGTTVGAGVVVALPATSCGIRETARIAHYMAGQSSGQCGPCVHGLPAIASDLERLAAGRADPGLVERIWHRAEIVEGRGACRHPDGVVRLVRSALAVFADDVLAHAQGRPCAGHEADTVLTFRHESNHTRRAA